MPVCITPPTHCAFSGDKSEDLASFDTRWTTAVHGYQEKAVAVACYIATHTISLPGNLKFCSRHHRSAPRLVLSVGTMLPQERQGDDIFQEL